MWAQEVGEVFDQRRWTPGGGKTKLDGNRASFFYDGNGKKIEVSFLKCELGRAAGSRCTCVCLKIHHCLKIIATAIIAYCAPVCECSVGLSLS